ncbi:unnamed protein product [Psylliodes chrysocephalus]|uniref:Uncharacterized protein n=1 Tax=Psylliodes chrysocephalus TaxID=3402493 RepID=A0A9P0DC21_9CUCU|nr:unnamed protein product [Psylliodes chrysocephala]
MPGQPSLLPSIPSRKIGSYMESYPSSVLLNGYTPSPSSSATSINSINSYRGLPPQIPTTKRYTNIRRPYSAGFDVPSERKPVMFQTRPLRSLTVVSDSPSRETSMTRSPSPTPSNYSMSSFRSNRSSSVYLPRRVYPQTYDPGSQYDLEDKEESPVVFDANLTFVLGCKGKLKQHVRPVPAHQEAQTASNALSNKISDFLSRTDHVMDEWKGLGHKEDEQHSLRMKRSRSTKHMGRSRSATNIMIKGFQYFSRASSCSRSSVGRDLEDCTDAEIDEV